MYPFAVAHSFRHNYKSMHYCEHCQLDRPVLHKACTLSPLSVMQLWCKLNYRANVSCFTSRQPEQSRAAFSWNLKQREFFPNGINRLDCRMKMEHKNSPRSYAVQRASAKSPVFILLGWRPVHHRPLKEQSCSGQCWPDNAQCNPIHLLWKKKNPDRIKRKNQRSCWHESSWRYVYEVIKSHVFEIYIFLNPHYIHKGYKV